MARPTKSDDEKLSGMVSCRVTKREEAEWLAKVKAMGMGSPSDVLREFVLGFVPPAPKRGTRERQQLVYLFNKVGNNINQLAHRANSDYLRGQLGRAEYDRLIYALEKIVEWHHKVLNHVD